MSNQNINISPSNVVGKCDLKCSYNFKYSESNSVAKNNGVTIDLTYDSLSSPPVTFNSQKYNVGMIRIVSPSIHNFNNASMPGEIIVTHNPEKGGNTLEVCIPITSSSESSSASQIITDIINKVSTNAPSSGDSTNLNISGFNLQNIIPKKPYFFYNQERTDYIVFGSIDAIPLSSSTISTLQQIIKPFPIPTPGGDLFYNSTGPISGVSIGDGLYISCQPTGSTKDEVAVEYTKNSSTSIDFTNIMQNQTFQIILLVFIGCILFILIFLGINAFYGYLTNDAVKLPTFTALPKFS